MRTFTLEEAQTLVPVLEALLKRAMEAKNNAEAVERKLQQVGQRIFLNGGTLAPVAKVALLRRERDAFLQQIKDTLTELDAIGVQVKDIDIGLLDFPCRLGDETVLLCWKMGEKEITHWHTLDAGFRGRQPIDERFRRTQKHRPN